MAEQVLARSDPARARRGTAWWLQTLRKRTLHQHVELDLSSPLQWESEAHHRAALKFFNAAFRAEESGLRQAHDLADEVAAWDPELAEVLRLYGNEEGWHRELLTQFLDYLGGGVQPMGRVTRLLYDVYGRAERMETIVLTNLMFETIGSTTYRLTLSKVREQPFRQMLSILTRDEAFHVPLNAHFLERVLERKSRWDVIRLRIIYHLLFLSLVALPIASRPKSGRFDRIETLELARAYAEQLGQLFAQSPELPFEPPRWLLRLLRVNLGASDGPALGASALDAARAADRTADIV